MSSPPPTPPSAKPVSKKDFRFHWNSTPCEWGESYHPGGFHPVHLGDVFKGQYRVIRKLGYGSFSTVWLAVDIHLSRYVALKIIVAELEKSANAGELSIYRHLGNASVQARDAQYVIALLDSFEHHGPNGKHLCLVFEPTGPSLWTMLRTSPEYEIEEPWGPRRLPKPLAKEMLRNILLGLRFLHGNGVVHSDVHSGNILFTLRGLNAIPVESLDQCSDHFSDLRRIDNKIDQWAPRYLVEPKALYEYTIPKPDPIIKMADMGSAFLAENPPLSTVTPASLRAPELILRRPFGNGIDIWCFGCLIFELITGRRLFYSEPFGDSFDEQVNDEHLIQFTEILQPLPEHLFAEWPRARQYYGPDGKQLEHPNDNIEDVDSGSKEGENEEDDDDEDEDDTASSLLTPPLADLNHFDSLETQFKTHKSTDIDEQEEKEIVLLLRQILQYDPLQRPSAAELLEHPWFYES